MSTVADIAQAIAEKTEPDTSAASWDPVGIQLGDPEAEVERIAVCHEVNEDVLTELADSPVDLLITYHPLLFTPTNRLVSGRSVESRALGLIRSGTSLLVTHTDFDAAPGGAADALAEALKLRDVEPFEAAQEGESEPSVVGRVGEHDATLAVLDALVTDLFGHVGLRITGDRERHIDQVVVVPGSGSRFVEEAANHGQALVTGDIPHHRAVLAADLGLAVVDPGHIATERPGMEALVSMVEEVADAEVVDLTGIDPRTWG